MHHVSVTPEGQCQGQYVTAPQGSVFVSRHAMGRTAVAADPVSLSRLINRWMVNRSTRTWIGPKFRLPENGRE